MILMELQEKPCPRAGREDRTSSVREIRRKSREPMQLFESGMPVSTAGTEAEREGV